MSNWIKDLIPPKIRSLAGAKESVDDLWTSCKGCSQMLHNREIENNLYVCPSCDHHHQMPVEKRLEHLFDNGEYTRATLPEVNADPLKFRDSKRYTDRIKDSRKKTGEDDAIVVAHGTIGGSPVVVACFNFAFMGGSMGMAVGNGILTASRLAVMQRAGLIIIPSSGGARMQESALSLMQMSRTTIGIQMVKEAGLPYIVCLTHPTTGGVSASFAMLGDIHIAEPKCMIGFAGRRVIEQTVREKLPDDFQTAEYLQEHGMVDMVLHRHDHPEKFAKILGMLMQNIKTDTPETESTEPESEDIEIPQA